jgi:hypothetical protein
VAEAKKEITLADFASVSASKDSKRTTSYPQNQEGRAPVKGAPRTTSYKHAMQIHTRGYETIN